MEALRFAPAQSPLFHTKFSTNDVVRTSKYSTLKPFIYAAVSKQGAESLPSAGRIPRVLSLTAAPPEAAEASVPLLRVSPSSLQCESGYLLPNENRGKGAVTNGTLNAMEYLTNILASKVYDVAYESPLQLATKLSQRWGVNVFSFKLRGAYNMMAKLPKEQLERGVICSSAGNHAQGVALSAQRLGCNAVIAMPVTTPEIKWRSVERLGATVVLIGDSYDEAQAYAKKRAEEEGRTFIPPFDHPDVIIGQGTVGMEIVKQMKGPIEAIFVPVGGGGLIAGIAAYVKRVSPDVKIIESNHSMRMQWRSHCTMTSELCWTKWEDMFEEKRSILEPAGALALAGAEAYCKYYGLKGANVVAVTSGANMNFDRLRLVTELADVGRREAVLATYMPEEPGSFKQFCELVNLELEAMVRRMKSAQLQTINLTENDLVKDHLRHLGETGANVLVGIQVAQSEMGEFRDRANSLGYEYELETSNEAFQLLMR
ncbi:hypothetical protein DH2020_039936 [Rehmannia glutinosa]|uniref:Tryptophan synthase beta chain-like PALP domain-containing protein n=1 Tax=Rehmannia glutinosa TaxID=99300 RepID=A0ABR0UUW9_REHGL